ncbi:MAG: serine hydrolase domain-containing protein [Mycobacteriaceae bacterium]
MIASLCVLLVASPVRAIAFASGGLGASRAPVTAASTPELGSAADIARFVNQQRDVLHLPGMAVVVFRDGRQLTSQGFGVAAPGGPPVTARTPFLLGSTSKQFTGLMVQRLILDGRLSLDTTVHEVLPWFGTDGDGLSRVTVRELLTHSSGLSTGAGLTQWGWRVNRADSIEAGARAITQADVTASPGERFEYSNTNYDILGAVIEGVTKQSYARAFDELVVAPLHLSATTADLGHPPSGLAAGYYVWLGRFPAVTPAPQVPSSVPSARIVSTASDLARVIQAHLSSSETVPLGSALAAARAPLLRVNEYSQYASGWWVRPLWELHTGDEDPTNASLASCVEHDGQMERSMSYLLACPSLGLGVVALANAGQGPDSGLWGRFHDGLVHVVLGTPPGTYTPDLVVRYTTVIVLGVPVVLFLALVAQARAVRRGRHLVRWSVPALLLGVGALWLGYVYAPSRAGDIPVYAMWSSVPDLAMSTIAGTVLTLTSLLVMGVAARMRAPSPDPPREPG